MTAQEFLTLLLPQSGYVVTATPNAGGKGWLNTCHSNIPSAVQHVTALTYSGKQAYYALSTYKEKKVWDDTWKNPAGEIVGKWRTRTQTNTLNIKSFFLDLDVDPEDDAKFNSKVDALTALREFCTLVGLPKPMVIDSGGGIHAYWPLAQEVATSTWRPVADIFKAICIHERFKADRSLTSDQARVLRCLGGFNFKRDHPVSLITLSNGPYDFDRIADILIDYKNQNSINVNATHAPSVARAAAGPAMDGAPVALEDMDSNLGSYQNEPLNFDRIAFSCEQLGAQMACRGAGVGEQLWRAGLGIVKFCENPRLAYRSISDGYNGYDEAATEQKIENWRTGPTACSHFHAENPLTCEACPSWEKITSPAQLGRQVKEAAPAIVSIVDEDGEVQVFKVPPPPEKYSRKRGGGVVIATETDNGDPIFEVVCPYDLFPIKILRQNGHEQQVDERSMWRVDIPRVGIVDLDISQQMISDTRKLTAHLMSKGVHLTQDQGKASQLYMSAYLQILAAAADREKLYERLGWHENHGVFVLGQHVIHRDGKTSPHIPSNAIRTATKDSITSAGSLGGWQQAMNFYKQPGMEGHRFFIYAALGAPLFHMNDTGNKGALLTASGPSGRGKTTCLKACASLWGKPEGMVINGNNDGTTINALYSILGTYCNLPLLWDDITEREPDALRRFLLNVSQGTGKVRMTAAAEIKDKAVEWQTLVLATANTDDMSRIMSSGKDVNPHLMRLVGVEFGDIDASPAGKEKADRLLRALNQNYGHVGPLMMKAVVQNYKTMVSGYIKNVAKVDRMLNSNNASAERYWSAVVAAAYTAGLIAKGMGILDFPVEEDLAWMVDHMVQQRVHVNDSSSSAKDLLVEFLNGHVRDTLTLSSKSAMNVDNVVQRPTNALLIRHDMDNKLIYVARSAILDHCTEIKTSFRKMEQELEQQGILTHKNTQKVLGADTVLAKGQTRCWRIDATRLGGDLALVPDSLPANVTAIGGATS
jgi:hypothetical protein